MSAFNVRNPLENPQKFLFDNLEEWQRAGFVTSILEYSLRSIGLEEVFAAYLRQYEPSCWASYRGCPPHTVLQRTIPQISQELSRAVTPKRSTPWREVITQLKDFYRNHKDKFAAAGYRDPDTSNALSEMYKTYITKWQRTRRADKILQTALESVGLGYVWGQYRAQRFPGIPLSPCRLEDFTNDLDDFANAWQALHPTRILGRTIELSSGVRMLDGQEKRWAHVFNALQAFSGHQTTCSQNTDANHEMLRRDAELLAADDKQRAIQKPAASAPAPWYERMSAMDAKIARPNVNA